MLAQNFNEEEMAASKADEAIVTVSAKIIQANASGLSDLIPID